MRKRGTAEWQRRSPSSRISILAQLARSVDVANRGGEHHTGTVLVNFFSYFTIDSNTLTVVVLLVGAVRLARRATGDSHALTVARAAVTTFMVITGVVYNLLLRHIDLPQGATVGWSNEILHVVAPAYVVLDWLLAPGRSRLHTKDALLVLAFPLAWTAYTLLRGPFASDPFNGTDFWYPYPFLNPVTASGGYAEVAAYVAGITVVFVAVALGLGRTTRRDSPARADRSPLAGQQG